MTLPLLQAHSHGTPITVRAEEEGVTPEEILNRYHPQFPDAYWVLGALESWNPPCRPALDREEKGGFMEGKKPLSERIFIGVAWQPYGPPSRQGYRLFLEHTNPNHRLGVIG